MEPKGGTPESALKMASLPFLRPGFLAKTRGCFMLTFDAPSLALFVLENGKVFFWDAFVQQEKVPQKK